MTSIDFLKRKDCEKGIELQIADNGQGISDKKLPRIFEAFYTTKKPLKGTGLGLSISKAIIKRHNGTIDVASIVGKGKLLIKNIAFGAFINYSLDPFVQLYTI